MTASHPSTRLAALDAFRGSTIAAMLLVNNPGSWVAADIYPQLQHAAWNGWTITDLVFPFFLVAVGVSMELSVQNRIERGARTPELLGHLGARASALVLLGLMQARFPLLERHPRGFTAACAAVGVGGMLVRAALLAATVALVGGMIAGRGRRRWLVALGVAVAVGVAGVLVSNRQDLRWLGHHMAHARVPGVLQRIGACVLLASGIAVPRRSVRWLAAWSAALLLATALWMLYVPIPGFGRPDLSWSPAQAGDAAHPLFANWGAWLDTRVFRERCFQVVHDPATGAVVWAFDPEGLASTPAALTSVLMGVAVGRWLRQRRGLPRAPVGRLLLLGAAGMAAGALLDRWIPINKQLWTSSYAVFTAGCACVMLAVWLQVGAAGWLRWATQPFVWYGRNALVLFLGSSLAATLAVHLRVASGPTSGVATRWVPLKAWIYALLSARLPARQASLLHAVAVVIMWAVVAGLLYRRRIFIKL